MCIIYMDKIIKLYQQTTGKDINKWKDNTHLRIERQYRKDNIEGRNPISIKIPKEFVREVDKQTLKFKSPKILKYLQEE